MAVLSEKDPKFQYVIKKSVLEEHIFVLAIIRNHTLRQNLGAGVISLYTLVSARFGP